MNNFASKKKLLIFLGIAVLLMVAGFWGWIFTGKLKEVKDLPVMGDVRPFAFMERNNQLVTRDDLSGNIWIADFVFTRCAGPCPLMTMKMRQLQKAFSNADDVKLVSFSVDPEFDTPLVLSKYAEQYEADPQKWLFLTGDKKEIYNFAQNSLKLTVKEATENSPIIHSTYFILVDRQGKIRGYYNSNEPNSLSRLATDVERLRVK